MTYTNHALLKFGGRWFATESWSCGLRIINQTPDWSQNLYVQGTEELIDELWVIVSAWFTRAGSWISEMARLDYVAFNAINGLGHYVSGNTVEHNFPSATAPTGPSTQSTWPQLTTVVSLRSALDRGRATHGRIYTPTGLTAQSNGRLMPSTTSAIATSAKTLVDAINGLTDPVSGMQPLVAICSNLGEPGPVRAVEKLLVGDVMDTQRRRRDQLPEVYHEVSISV